MAVLRALADLFVAHEIPATPLTSADVVVQDYLFLAMALVAVNKHFWCRCQGRHMLKNLFKFGKISMVSGQWSGRTTMLSSFCVKTGVVSDQFQFANEFHDESESTSRRA